MKKDGFLSLQSLLPNITHSVVVVGLWLMVSPELGEMPYNLQKGGNDYCFIFFFFNSIMLYTRVKSEVPYGLIILT